MGEVVSGLAVFAVVIAVGWALVRFGAVPAGSDTILTGVCFYAATPALLVTTIGGADLATVVSRATLAGLLAETLGIVSAWLVHRFALRRSVAESTIGALAAGYVNAANLGIPVLVVLLGDATAIAPILLLQLLVISPAAFAVLDVSTARGRGTGPGPAAWTAPLRNPLLLGVVVGLVVNLTGWDAGAAAGGLVANSLGTLGALAVTLMMLSLGMSLAASSPRVTRRLTVARVTRLRATGPGAAAGILGAEGSDGGEGTPSSGGAGGPSSGGKGAPSSGGAVPGGGEGTPSPGDGGAGGPSSGDGGAPVAGGADGGAGGPEGSADRGERGAVLWVSVAWKLAVVPLLALGLGAALGLRGPALLVPITTAGLPSAQNVFMYATRYGAAKPLARDCVLLTTAGFVPVVLLAAAILS